MVCDLMRYAARAPLCKGSCREATEGLCGTVLQFRMHFGEKAVGNDFAVESSYFNDASAKRGQNGHCSFGRWAHREVHHYNPSVSYADSSPYTGEPLTRPIFHPLTIHQTARQIPICRTTERYRAGQGIYDYANEVHDLAARPAGKFQFVSVPTADNRMENNSYGAWALWRLALR